MGRSIEKVFAYIVRESDFKYDELLVLSHKNSLQIPSGTVIKGEDILDSLKRGIYEETGINNYEVIKKIGEVTDCEFDLEKDINIHFFLVRVHRDTKASVAIKGRDMKYYCTWYHPQEVLLIHNQFHQFLSPDYIPTLFPDEVMLGLNNQKVSLMPDSEFWREEFKKEKIIIQSKIQGEFKIEHIGSTAIPNIPAKPIIDIGVGIDNSKNIKGIIKLLEEIG